MIGRFAQYDRRNCRTRITAVVAGSATCCDSVVIHGRVGCSEAFDRAHASRSIGMARFACLRSRNVICRLTQYDGRNRRTHVAAIMAAGTSRGYPRMAHRRIGRVKAVNRRNAGGGCVTHITFQRGRNVIRGLNLYPGHTAAVTG